ncbi:hypothetical protein J2S22_003614 [Rhodoplanes tepidamans]|uniref:TonB C-terminal domain-containing protein n=1 Tax=Rhodoplanes tepidamans TaxID=200616 RepID=A0ABT5J3I7_RHOTP|nr:hypothetical protein [Rhodoplanes tepidamans]MDC7784229.1 hypothetical protein [Rhodoplanes tepidamans]MDQ0356673.1 hypothetical protein [Rhodoplanes tepidamans]
MRLALAISVMVHALLWGLAALQVRPPFAAANTPIAVELVRPDEIPERPKEAEAAAEPDKPAEPQQQAQAEPPAQEAAQSPAAVETPAPQPARSEPQQQASAPPAEPAAAAATAPETADRPGPQLASADPSPTGAAATEPAEGEGASSWYDSPLMNVSIGYETTERKAKLTDREIAAFKAHLRACWQPPAALADAPARLSVVLRVALAPSGALAGEPTLLAASASPKGAVLMQTAMAALARCQPVGLLPAAKYQEWKLLDLAFSPAGLTGLPKL